jgi:hypothetical protein
MVKHELAKSVQDKLLEYGIEVYSEYETESKSYALLYPEMAIVVDKEETVTISFHAMTRPDVAALNVLIIKEIDQTINIKITDSFIFDTNKKIYCGEEAYKAIERSIGEKAIMEHEKEMAYTQALEQADCFKC